MTGANLRIVRAAVAVAVLILATAQGRAQSGRWEQVKLVEPGKRVRVELRSGRPVNGTLEEWTPETVRVRRGGGGIAHIARAEVDRLSMVIGMSRRRKAAWAAAATAGIVGGLGTAVCVKEGGSGSEAGFVAAAVGFYSAVAAGVAALFPPHREVVYEAELPLADYVVQPLGATPAVPRGRSLDVRVQIRDTSGKSLASPRLAVRALEVVPAAGGPSLPALNARRNDGHRFRYEPGLGAGGGYSFRLSTATLPPGEYALTFRVGADATVHQRAFAVK